MSEAGSTLVAACPGCGRRFELPLATEGKAARCPCGKEFRVQRVVETATLPDAAPAEKKFAPPPIPATPDFAAAAAEYSVAAPARGVTAFAVVGVAVCRGRGRRGLARHSLPVPPGIGRRGALHELPCAGVRDVRFRGGAKVHLCPRCAVVPGKLAGYRKVMAGWSLVAATWGTFLIAAMVTGLTASMSRDKVGQIFLGFAMVIPAGLGLGLSISSWERRAGNPPLVWITIAWNAVFAVLWTVAAVIGSMHH